MNGTIDFSNPGQNGAYLVGAADLDTLDAAAHDDGHLVRRVSLSGCHAKPDLLLRIATSLEFPNTFGMNWDALADCLGDLAWLPQAGGYTWLFDHAADLRDTAEPDFDTLCDLLNDTCVAWREHGTPCFAFLALPDDAFAGG